jgi:hypothetical protein
MINLYNAIRGKKHKLIGQGETLIEAINDAGIEFYDGVETDDQKESYVQGASQDYVIEQE